MGFLSMTILFASLLTMIVLRKHTKLSLLLLLIMVAVLLNRSLGFERAVIAIIPLIFTSISYLVCDRSNFEIEHKFSVVKYFCIILGAVIVVFIQKYLMAIFELTLNNKYDSFDSTVFYFLPLVVVVGAIIIREIGLGVDYYE